MSDATFGPAYANAYDILYADKDYAAEAQVVERASQELIGGVALSILDLGCGTGRHAIELGRRGHAVDGVDRAPDMLRIARGRLPSDLQGRVRYMEGDVRTVRTGRRYDVVLLMFAVLGYQLSDDDVRSTLATARRHLRDGGVLIFDVWYGPAVEAIGPDTRVKEIALEAGKLERRATGKLEGGDVASVTYELAEVGRAADNPRTVETHRMRYFFREYLERELKNAGFDIRRLTASPSIDRPADETTWNALVVAQADHASG